MALLGFFLLFCFSFKQQAINAVASKLATIKGGVLVFGNERNMREDAKKYLLKASAVAQERLIGGGLSC